jgi:hypothetical protein
LEASRSAIKRKKSHNRIASNLKVTTCRTHNAEYFHLQLVFFFTEFVCTNSRSFFHLFLVLKRQSPGICSFHEETREPFALPIVILFCHGTHKGRKQKTCRVISFDEASMHDVEKNLMMGSVGLFCERGLFTKDDG